MMKEYMFIEEVSNRKKVRSFLILLTILLFLTVLMIFFSFNYESAKEMPIIGTAYSNIEESVSQTNLLGLFYANLFGGFFFIPSPDEVIFYYGLTKSNPPLLAFLVTMAGYLLAQLFNYVLGRKLSEPITNIVSKKKLYDTRRYVNKYGALGIFLFNLLPFPAPLLTLGLGITNYNFTRLMILTIAGKGLKYLAIILFYLLVT